MKVIHSSSIVIEFRGLTSHYTRCSGFPKTKLLNEILRIAKRTWWFHFTGEVRQNQKPQGAIASNFRQLRRLHSVFARSSKVSPLRGSHSFSPYVVVLSISVYGASKLVP